MHKLTAFRIRSKIAWALALLILLIAGLLVLRHLGEWLEAEDALRPSFAIVVLGGGIPFRAMEAARLYNAKWAGQVWITQGKLDERARALASLGLAIPEEHDANQMVLEKLGVPSAAIHLIPERVDNTLEEEKAIKAYARNSDAPIILVTSKYHARRARVIWDIVTGGHPPAIVRYTPEETYDAARWWANSTDALLTFKELFGIVNARAGFPIAPR